MNRCCICKEIKETITISDGNNVCNDCLQSDEKMEKYKVQAFKLLEDKNLIIEDDTVHLTEHGITLFKQLLEDESNWKVYTNDVKDVETLKDIFLFNMIEAEGDTCLAELFAVEILRELMPHLDEIIENRMRNDKSE